MRNDVKTTHCGRRKQHGEKRLKEVTLNA